MTAETKTVKATTVKKKRGRKPAAPETKARGRPRNSNYLPWEEARAAVQAEMIPSRSKFFEWWEREEPKSIPRFPYRVYVDEWVSWNDFLGTNNKFNEKIGTKWRPFEEAILWVHLQKVPTKAQWLDRCKEEGFLPEDVPARPDLLYNKWVSWNHWLGASTVEKAVVQQQVQRTAVYYIIHDKSVPGNVLTFGVEHNGMAALKDRWEHEKFEIVKLYWYDQTVVDKINQVVTHYSSSYLGDERQRIVPNVWDIIWYLDMMLDTVRG